MPTGFNFGAALEALRIGHWVRRLVWPRGRRVGVWRPSETASDMTEPYLYEMHPVGDPAHVPGGRHPYVPTQTDIFAVDWELDDRG